MIIARAPRKPLPASRGEVQREWVKTYSHARRTEGLDHVQACDLADIVIFTVYGYSRGPGGWEGPEDQA